MLSETALSLRNHKLTRATAETFDLLIIGGGITGAGIALDAASRGLKVILAEKEDYASGTSSRSTKLIHGGLRYLKNLEIGLVREVGRERNIARKNAPHLVIPEKMLLPLYKSGSLGKWEASAGIYLYDWLADVKPGERRKMLTADETYHLEPSLNKEELIGGALYSEYRTDDARLTMALIKTAEKYGAITLNYLQAENPTYQNGKITGFSLKDHISGKPLEIKAKGVINAAGPWADEIRKANQSLEGKKLVLSKGVHLVFPFRKLPISHAIYADVKQDPGRMIFIIPRGRSVYAGTTDTYYPQADNPNVTKEDVNYLIQALNAIFPDAKLTESDIESTWSGVRPLIGKEGKSASEISRKDELFISPTGLVTIAGGKLTGYRKMAERSVDAFLTVNPDLKPKTKPCFTADISLSGAAFTERKFFLEKLRDAAGQIPHSTSQLEDLFEKYGSESGDVIDIAYELYNENRTLKNPITAAELYYTILFEQVIKPADFFIRRTGMLYFNRPKIQDIQTELASFWGPMTGLPENTLAGYEKEFRDEFGRVLHFE
jgi:glycerol-3-phosphate dehydrogenase